ncbi:AzlC family ABC transporter permease [Aquibium sp. A9E412]|uniref:AzlC family ABC transporter permease n=1 Tax=Aquibium sp. A9E412 TaxID=2976767 RepID=UPI0025AFA482|nr:AzlC family ABC transporter permease [Aquibium sp. A9E412]MDN2567541.1 AzlC family ABC transporter permease [Aquibium sp. A9E412]
MVAAAPFGILFGTLAVENGFSVFQVVLMSATVYAGASQMVGLDLFGQAVAPWLIVLSIFAVNFRHVLYSAAVGRRVRHWSALQKAVGFFFLVDPQYAESERRALSGTPLGFGWYMAMAMTIYVFWIVNSALGALFGRLIPDTDALGLDFLLPIYFLGLVMGFRRRPLFLPVVVASALVSVAAFELVGSPWHVSIGALAGIAVAALAPVPKDGDAR